MITTEQQKLSVLLHAVQRQYDLMTIWFKMSIRLQQPLQLTTRELILVILDSCRQEMEGIKHE